jgi:hypothetical protein
MAWNDQLPAKYRVDRMIQIKPIECSDTHGLPPAAIARTGASD